MVIVNYLWRRGINRTIQIQRLFSFTIRMSKKSKQTSKKTENIQVTNDPVRLDKNGDIAITILAKPGAKLNSITAVSEEGVGVQISAPPTDGEANAELLKYLSKVLGVRKSDISLDKGGKSRNKIVLISNGATNITSVLENLNKEII